MFSLHKINSESLLLHLNTMHSLNGIFVWQEWGEIGGVCEEQCPVVDVIRTIVFAFWDFIASEQRN